MNLIACRDGMVVRAIARNNFMLAYVDNLRYGFVDNEITTGKAGVGVRGAPAGNGIQVAQLGPLDRVAPSAVTGSTLSTSVYPNFVDMQWQPPNDDANGAGIAYFYIERVGGGFSHWPHPAATTDATVAASTAYSYTLYAADFHENWSPPIVFQVTTPAAGAIDPRQVGVRSRGSYWARCRIRLRVAAASGESAAFLERLVYGRSLDVYG